MRNTRKGLTMSKKLLCIICSLVISLSIFVVPSFADSLNNLEFQTLPFIDTLPSNPTISDFTSNGFQIISTYYNNYINYILVNKDNLYLVAYQDGSNITITLVSPLTFNPSSTYLIGRVTSSNYFTSSKPSGTASYSSDYDLYYSYTSIPNVKNSDILNVPFYSSFNDALSAVRDYIDNGGSSDVISYITHVSVEPGTVLYIGYNPNIDLNINGTTRFPMRSTLSGGNFPNSSQTYSFATSLPSSGTTFPLSNASKLPWIKNEPYNILGQSFNAKLENFVLANSSQGFYVIHNPYFVNVENFNSAGDLNKNSNLELDISGYTSLRIYPLQDEILNSSSPDNFNVFWDGSSTDNGDGTGSVSWIPTAEDGSDVSNIGSNPNNLGINGGGNLDSSSIIQDIKDTLDKFVNNFISFVSAPISHIQNLISAGSGFMSALQGMYAWLPAQIQGYLISALTLIIAIGVFKVFL